MRRGTALLAIAFTLLFAGAAFAQTGGIVGLVTDCNGAPVEGARVSLWANGACTGTFAMSGPDGSFAFTDVAPGTYTVHAGKKNVGQARVENVVVYDGQVTNVGTLVLIGQKAGGKVLPSSQG